MNIFNNFNQKNKSKVKILVIGDLILDKYWFGSVKRISPEAPIPIIHVKDFDERLGGAGNVALNILSLGSTQTVVSLIGKDSSSFKLKALLKKKNILNHLIQIQEYKPPTKIRLINRYQQIVRADFENENNNNYSFSLNAILKNLSRFKCIIISDYGKGTINNPKKIIALANKYNIPILIDPVGNDFNKYKNATILTPNLSEFENIVGICKSKNELGIDLVKLE